jgi:hypothetical protein
VTLGVLGHLLLKDFIDAIGMPVDALCMRVDAMSMLVLGGCTVPICTRVSLGVVLRDFSHFLTSVSAARGHSALTPAPSLVPSVDLSCTCQPAGNYFVSEMLTGFCPFLLRACH